MNNWSDVHFMIGLLFKRFFRCFWNQHSAWWIWLNNNLEYPYFEKKIVIAGKFIFHNLCFNGNISHLFSHFLQFGAVEVT